MANKGLSVYTHQGEDYIINDPNNAPEFDVTAAYTKGQYVTYKGDLYKLTEDHAANTTWSNTKKMQVTIGAEMLNAMSAIADTDCDGFGGQVYENLLIPNQGANQTSKIWFRPYEKYGSHIYQIEYLAITGTTKFYKIHYEEDNPSAFTYTLLYSIVNSSAENNKIKKIYVDIDMSENEYIGINGAFAYSNSSGRNTYSRNYTISSGSLSGYDKQSLLFNVTSSDSAIGKEVLDLKKRINDVYNGAEGGVFFEDLESAYLYTNNTDRVWFRNDEKFVSHINQFRFVAITGTINFYKVHFVPGTSTITYSLITSIVNTGEEQGKIKTAAVDVTLEENDCIGINGAFAYRQNPVNGHKTRDYIISTSTLSDENSQALVFNAEYKESLANRILSLEEAGKEKPDLSRIGEVVLYNALLTQANADIDGTQAFDSYGMTVGSRLVLDKFYSVSDRTIRFLCKFGSDTVAEFGTTKKSGSTYTPDTRIFMDIGNQTIKLNSLTPKWCTILNSTDEFMISITKHYQDIQIEVQDIYTGEKREYLYTTNGTGGEGAGAEGTLFYAGMQYDYYNMALSSGTSFSCRQIVIVCAKCDLLMYGDSITEPEAYWPTAKFPKSWTQLVREKMKNRAMSSGRSGTTINEIMLRIENELPLIKPKYCMVTIGTNGGDTVSNLTTLVQYIKSLDVIPILNHIPCYDNNGDTTGFRTINGYIDTVRASENVKGCNFDLATSVNHDGQDVDTSTMWYEDYTDRTYYHHPNVKGSANMFARLLMDVPEIFE